MAKGKAAAASCIDGDTITMLESDVKKKKPRKFFVIYKGAQIKTLVVFKKGPFGPLVMKAKKAGHIGDAVFGIVVGSGEKLTFMLAGTDAVAAAMKVDACVNDAPLAAEKFKKFLKENGLRYKPSFQVITDVNDVVTPEGEDPGGAAAPARDEGPEEDDVRPADAPATEADPAETFKRRLAELVPQIKQAGETPQAMQAKTLAGNAAARAKSGDFEAAGGLLEEAERALAAAAAASPNAPPVAASLGDDALRWQQRQTAMAAAMKQLQDAGGDLSQRPELTKFAKGAQEFGKRGEFAKAHKIADEVDRLLAEALQGARRPDAESAVPTGFVRKQVYLRERWREVPFEVDARVNGLRPRIGNDLTVAVNEALRNLIAEIDEGIQDSVDQGGRDFGPAIVAIDKAEQTVRGDALIQHLEQHPVLAGLGVESTFLAALSELKTQLTA